MPTPPAHSGRRPRAVSTAIAFAAMAPEPPAAPAGAQGNGHSKTRFLRSRSRTARGLQPPRQRDHLLPWLTLLAVLAVACVPMLIELSRPDVTDLHEAATIVTSVQTWRAEETLPDEYRGLAPPTPRFNGQPVVDRPPGVTWLHLLAFGPLQRDTATVDDLVFAARVASVLFALLTVASVFWIGMSVGGITTAIMAALVCLSLPIVLFDSRLATPAIPQLGAAMFATAAALWAARPLKPPTSIVRQAIGWTLCGVGLGATALLGGVGIMPKVLLPLAAMLAVCPRRIGYLLALAAACAMAALLATPWALHVHEHEPQAWRSWVDQLIPSLWTRPGDLLHWQGGRLGWLLLATAPWTLWLFGALGQPFSSSSASVRSRMLMGWVWFVSSLVLLLALPPERDPTQVMLVLPAAAFLVGQVFRQFTDLSDEGRHARFWAVARFPHLTVLLIASIALPMALASQRELISDGFLSAPAVLNMGWMYWTGLSLALVGITALSMRFALKHYPARAAACWAAWVVVAWAVLAIPVARGPMARNPVRAEAAELARIVQSSPVAFVAPGAGTTHPPADPDPALLLYANLTVPTLTPEQARQLTEDGQMFYVLTPESRPPGPSWRPVLSLKATGQQLWHTLEGRSIAQPNPAKGRASR